MPSNLDRYKKDLDALIAKGERVTIVMQHDCFPKETEDQIKSQLKDGAQKFISALEPFSDIYQAWYSEAKMLIGQLLPDRSYRLEDYLQGLTVSHLGDEIVQKSAAIPHLQQQLAILKAVKARFESSLFDIRQLVQSDLFDSELDAAKELAKHGFARAAGALAGVVLERHLAQVCDNHKVTMTKKNPGIAEFNDVLKAANAIDVPQWRFVQHLGDIRNLRSPGQ